MQSLRSLVIRSGTTLLIALSLTACGGGGGGDASTANTAVQAPEGLSQTTQEATVSVVSQVITVTPSSDGKTITVSPALTTAGGTRVTTLNQLPEGIANSAWMATATNRPPLRVVLKDGIYRLAQPWTWTASASGRSDSPITIAAETPGKAIITGSETVVASKATFSGQSTVQVNLTGLINSPFEQLWVNGRRAVRARSPNVGSFYFVKGAVATWGGDTILNQASVDKQAFLSENAATTLWNSAQPSARADAILVAVHSWTTSHHHITAINASNQVLVSPASRWAFLSKGDYQRYFIENLPQALDAPSEWYFSSATKQLSYIPTSSESTSDITFEIPTLDTLLEIKGQASNGQWVQYLNFSGLKFRHAGYSLPSQGLADQQAAVDVPAALMVDAARNISITDCEVAHVGGYAVWLRSSVQSSLVQNCEIYDAGAGGIRIGLASQPSTNTATGYNKLLSNRIHSVGHQFPGAVGIWIGQSAYNTVESNLIGDTTYSGISAGWTWGYSSSPSHHNQINRNFLYDIMQGSLSDGGAIYTLGRSTGTEIKGNVIRGVQAYNYYGAGGWGIFGDEGSSDILMDSNIIVNSEHAAYMLNFGATNTVSNNIFAGGRLAELQVGKIENSLQANVENNIFIPTTEAFIAYPSILGTPSFSFRNNRVSRQYVSLSNLPSICGSGCAVADNITIDVAGKLDVPRIYSSGSQIVLPFPLAPSWAAIGVSSVDSPSWIWGKQRGFSFDAAQAPLGSRPMGFKVIPAERPELISVSQLPSGDRCLAFNDDGSLQNRWEPFGYVEADYASGTTSVSFTLKVDAAAEFIHQWRDPSGSTYLTGPAVTFSGTKGVVVNGQTVAPLPVGQWVTVTVTSPQGGSPRWSFSITYPDNSVRSFSGLSPVSDNWSRTRAFYFISNATGGSMPCIGKWSITNS